MHDIGGMREDQQTTNADTAERNHGRAPDKTAISLSLDKYTLNMLDRAALSAGRTRSNFVRWIIRQSLAQGR
jgi:hypothetical protein